MSIIVLLAFAVLIQLVFALSLVAEDASRQNKVTVNISKIQSSEGQIILCVYNSSENYDKRKAFQEFRLEPKIDSVSFETQLPDGEYLIMLCHDINMNGDLDTGFMSIPKEPIGLSNYDGKGIPGKFKKHKFDVTDDTIISIPLKTF